MRPLAVRRAGFWLLRQLRGQPPRPPRPLKKLPLPHMRPPKYLLDDYPTPVEDDPTVSVVEDILSQYGVSTTTQEILRGPTITTHELLPGIGTRVASIQRLSDDVARALGVASVRILAPTAGKTTVSIEVPNPTRQVVGLRPLIEEYDFLSRIPVFLGRDVVGKPVIADLTKWPHALIAGTTGSGKSVCISTIIMSIIYMKNPTEVQLVLIDPKMVELSMFAGIPHLRGPVVTATSDAVATLTHLVAEMEARYTTLMSHKVRNISGYNGLAGISPLPYIVCIIDEMADLIMTCDSVEDLIVRIAQKARAVGIHLVLATQRPQANVITGLIKANMPTKIAFQVSSKLDSRIILDANGAESLLGQGDGLYLPSGVVQPIRIQGTYITDREITATVNFVRRSPV